MVPHIFFNAIYTTVLGTYFKVMVSRRTWNGTHAIVYFYFWNSDFYTWHSQHMTMFTLTATRHRLFLLMKLTFTHDIVSTWQCLHWHPHVNDGTQVLKYTLLKSMGFHPVIHKLMNEWIHRTCEHTRAQYQYLKGKTIIYQLEHDDERWNVKKQIRKY